MQPNSLALKPRTERPSDSAWKRINTEERTAGASKLICQSLHALVGFRAELGALKEGKSIHCAVRTAYGELWFSRGNITTQYSGNFENIPKKFIVR